jgi:multidrug efflux pump subunit AcrB
MTGKRNKNYKTPAFSVIMIFTAIFIAGWFFVPLLSVKLAPSRNLPEVNVSFSMYGQSARVIEMEVTSKLEAMLSRIKGIKNITSLSGNGHGRIRIEPDKHVNPEMFRFEVSTIIRQTWSSLPDGVSYPSVYMSKADSERPRTFMSYTFYAPMLPLLIQKYAEDNIRPVLAEIKGIDKINISGASRIIRKLEYNYEHLRNFGVTVEDITNSIQSYLTREFIGIGHDDEAIRLALVPEYIGAFDASKIQVKKNPDGKIIYLNQVVKSTIEEEEVSNYFRINGLNTVTMTVSADENANQMALSRMVKEQLEQIQAFFPSGFELHLSYDSAEYLTRELNKIYFRSGLTLFILICFVLLFYRNPKYSFIILFSLAVNLSLSVIFYYLLGLEIHLYSLAGITISLTLIIDNYIVMSDHIIRKNNKKTFLAIFAATLTTVASLFIVFFMDINTKTNLVDFASVVIVNLVVSLVVALFLVPALTEKLHTGKYGGAKQKNKTIIRHIVYLNRFYETTILFICRHKVLFGTFLILAFGLPVYMLPDKLEPSGLPPSSTETVSDTAFYIRLYNSTIGSEFYNNKMRKIVDKALGGTMRLFATDVYSGRYRNNNPKEETVLYVNASQPSGTTLKQMDNLMRKMENHTGQYPGVKQFETYINGAQSAYIVIRFVEEHQNSMFPVMLKNELVTKAIELGGGTWGIYGVGEAFSNDDRAGGGQTVIKLLGYNYDDLNIIALALRDSLLQNIRIGNVIIDSKFNWLAPDDREYVFDLDMERIMQKNFSPYEMFYILNPLFRKNARVANWTHGRENEDIRLYSKHADNFDIWNIENYPARGNDKFFKLSGLSKVTQIQNPQDIEKENQQYRLFLQYGYTGHPEMGSRFLNQTVDKFRKKLSPGYKIELPENILQRAGNAKHYMLLLLIIVIMFFTCGILFNSLKQPFAVIFIIPVSYIGIFLTFYLFDLKFDQGGFAAFVLLSGIAVNSNIYIINEFNIINKRVTSPFKAYMKAVNAKMRPIFLTEVSTIVGFIPFMTGFRESFWFPLAAGTIGGVVVSFIATFLFLPMFILKK